VFGDEDIMTLTAEHNRTVLERSIQELMDIGYEPSTVQTYEQCLSKYVTEIESQIQVQLLPMNTYHKFLAMFAPQRGLHWSRTKILKSAVRAWHTVRGEDSYLDTLWDDRARLFWRALKKQARHESHAKRPVEIDEQLDFVKTRCGKRTEAGVRDANMANFAFYGVRRARETIQVRRSHFSMEANCAKVFIPKQKNDPLGKGMYCVIPKITNLGQYCPATMLHKWVLAWDAKWVPIGIQDGPLFYVTEKQQCIAVSPDSWRKSWKGHTGNDEQVSTHSLRKGGAKWYKFATNLSDDAIQTQGGWADQPTMLRIYARETAQQLQQQLINAADSLIPSDDPASWARYTADR
jgi:integrase